MGGFSVLEASLYFFGTDDSGGPLEVVATIAGQLPGAVQNCPAY